MECAPRPRRTTIASAASAGGASGAMSVELAQKEYAVWRKDNNVEADKVEVAYFGEMEEGAR